MSIDDMKKSFGKPVAIGLVTLILGVVIGVAAEKHSSRNAATLASAQQDDTVTTNDSWSDWDPFQEMRDMQAQMDRMFQRSITRFHMNPQMNLFKDDAGYSLSLDVRDLKDRYEVHAMLPDAKAADTKVNLEGNRLSVEVSNKHTETGNNSAQPATTEFGDYKQVIQLADNVKSDQMKVERKNHELVITIPKA